MMNHFSIRDIENITGIKTHTLRIWEQRYGIPSPKRTASNIRYYDSGDLKLLLNISLLNRQGHRISKLSAMNREELEQLVADAVFGSGDVSAYLDALTAAMLNLDEFAFEKTFSRFIMKAGIERTVIELFFPFLNRVGLLWQSGQINPAFEHFVSNLVRQKLIVALDQIPGIENHAPQKFLLFLPEGELHELGLLFSNYLVRSRGHRSVYLGQSLPFSELDHIVTLTRPDFILTAMTTAGSRMPVQSFLDKMGGRFPNQKLLFTGRLFQNQSSLKMPSNGRRLESVEEFIDLLGTQ